MKRSNIPLRPELSGATAQFGKNDYTSVRYAPVVNCVVQYKDRIFLVQRSAKLNFYPNLWNGISGFLDDNKSVEEKARQELQEELGLTKKDIMFLEQKSVFIQEDPQYKKTWIVHPVHVAIRTNKIKTDWEAQKYKWIDVKEVNKFKLVPGFDKVIASFFGEDQGMRPKVGLGVMIFKDRKVLLGKRKGTHGTGEYAPPGGHLEHLESFEECAKREAREEAGIEIKNVQFLSLRNLIEYAPNHYVNIGLTAEWKRGIPKVMEPDRCEGWGWYDIDNLPSPLFKTVSVYVEALKTKNHYFDNSFERKTKKK